MAARETGGSDRRRIDSIMGRAGGMPTERETFFIGICVRVSGAAASVEVRMQRHGATIRDVSGSSRLLFPPHGAVELAGAPARSLSPGGWVAFSVVSHAPPRAPPLPVTAD